MKLVNDLYDLHKPHITVRVSPTTLVGWLFWESVIEIHESRSSKLLEV